MTTAVTVMIETVMFYTDAPELVLGRDEFGTAYLCLLVSLDAAGHHYLAIKISSSRLMELRSGRMDLRHALVTPERADYFSGHIQPGERVAITLEPLQDVPPEWFPQEGFLLSNFEGVSCR